MTLEDLEQRLGHRFTRRALLKEALTHRSFSADNNERLEFLGDSLVNFIVAADLFERFPDAREGQLSRLRASMVRGKTLAEIARELELGSMLRLGVGEKKSGGAQRLSLLADALEAVIGAIYLDAGMQTCEQVVRQWFETRLADLSLDRPIKDAKSQLQEILQARKFSVPDYRVLQITGSDHEQQFEVVCEVSELALQTFGKGSSRKTAEQKAASDMIRRLEGHET